VDGNFLYRESLQVRSGSVSPPALLTEREIYGDDEQWFMDDEGNLFATPLADVPEKPQSLQLKGLMMSDPFLNSGATLGGSSGSLELQDAFTSRTPPKKEYKKTIRFADTVALPMTMSESSIETLDVFMEGASSHSKPPSSQSLGDFAAGDSDDDDDDDDDQSFATAIDEEEDQDKKIKRQMLFAIGSVGLMGLMGWGAKNLLRVFDKSVRTESDIDGGMDITNAADGIANVNDIATAVASGGDGGTSIAATTAAQSSVADAAALHASQSQSFGAGLGFNPGGGGGAGAQMSSAQTQVLQSMAVNAASNAASSAASMSTAMASTAAAAAAGVAAAGTAATVTSIATVVSTNFCARDTLARLFKGLPISNLDYLLFCTSDGSGRCCDGRHLRSDRRLWGEHRYVTGFFCVDNVQRNHSELDWSSENHIID
jgi:hypothetical protein